ncbi:MAG: MopE-related protein [Segetibacter sp.]
MLLKLCNGIDDDCDGQIDEGLPTVTYYRDADGDGYGNVAISTTSCSQPTGYVTNSTDCNDASGTVYPGAVEVCGNGIDDNCNGQIDENCGGLPTISINDVSVYESEGVAVVTISLDRVSASAISINYATQSGTAIGSGKGAKTFDFTTASGSVTIAAGTKTAQIRITITKDNIAEVAENFKVNLSLDAKNAKKATFTRSSEQLR